MIFYGPFVIVVTFILVVSLIANLSPEQQTLAVELIKSVISK